MRNLKEIFFDFNESKKSIFNNKILDIWFLTINKYLNENELDNRFFIYIKLTKWFYIKLWRRKRIWIYFNI